MNNKLDKIRRLVGAATKEQLRYVDCFVGEHIGLFMPVGGACFYALTPEHSHPSYMFVFHFDDQTSLRLNGRTITARHGKMFALSPGIAHQELPSETPPRYIAALIGKEFFDDQLALYPAGKDSSFHGEFFDIPRELKDILNQFMVEADNAIPGSEAVLHALSLEIAHAIIRCIFGLKPVRDRISVRSEIDRAIEYLHANIANKIGIGHMAEIACMSPSHFARTFKSETGMPPAEYMKRIRLERAKKLLLLSDKSVTEIAFECGFGSPAYLSASFYKKFKITPSDFRQTAGKNSISKKYRRISKV